MLPLIVNTRLWVPFGIMKVTVCSVLAPGTSFTPAKRHPGVADLRRVRVVCASVRRQRNQAAKFRTDDVRLRTFTSTDSTW